MKVEIGVKVKLVQLRQSKHSNDNLWESQFLGQVGTVSQKCPLYKGAWVIRFSRGLASCYPDELEAVR